MWFIALVHLSSLLCCVLFWCLNLEKDKEKLEKVEKMHMFEVKKKHSGDEM
jgi:hypothetical protein